MTFERWDVLTALFPFVASTRRKPRPVLVLSGSDFDDAHDHIITAMITTTAAGRWASDHSVTDLAAAGLLRPCVVRWKIFSLPEDTVARKIGTMGSSDRNALSSALDDVMKNPAATTQTH